jgi:DNA-binding XRE family transcriptional regulator
MKNKDLDMTFEINRKVIEKKVTMVTTNETISNVSINMYIAIRLREIRKSKGLTQSKVALQMGCNPTNIVRIEKGERQPRLETLIRILKVLDSTFEDILPKDVMDIYARVSTEIDKRKNKEK